MNDDNTKAAAIKAAAEYCLRLNAYYSPRTIGETAGMIVHNLNKELARLEEKK